MIHNPSQKLLRLRRLMKQRGLQAYVIPRQDEFQGEYVAAYAERLKWLSDFSGSWGTAIVGMRKATLFVDGRYTVQAKAQVSKSAWAHKNLIDEPPVTWVKSQLRHGDKLGYDPMLLTVSEAKRYANACAEVGAKFISVAENLIDAVWEDRPPRPTAPLFTHSVKFAGRSAADKLKDLASELKKQHRDCVLLTDPSSVAWVLNLRGSDVPYTPVVLAYALVYANARAEIFIEQQRLPKGLGPQITAVAPELFAKYLLSLKGKVIQLDEANAPDFALSQLRKTKARIVFAADPCVLPKACKNKVEQRGAVAAQKRDGAALVRFLHWFSVAAPQGKLDERQVSTQLHTFRQETGKLVDLSFESIPAAGPNAALPHYHMPENGGRRIKTGEIFLIDSGGQYKDGTTDVTRTLIVGEPSAEMKDRFTRVLKGMIAISVLRFPQATTGAHIDALARASLWAGGFDFDHGTGHGVGSFLSVHEGPQRISKAGHAGLQPGMIVSNEPGYYRLGHYGIRIENLLLVTAPAKIKGGDRAMLGFETLTLAPIERALIDTRLLTRDELHWLDCYHARVLAEIGPLLPAEAAQWLAVACAHFN